MKSRSHNRHVAFTLLELVVVLGILAVVTGLAVRAIDRVEDQRRFENAQRGMEEIEAAVLGSPDDRAVDGTRTISGFVADMGRLPRTKDSEKNEFLTLSELWKNPGEQSYDVRRAVKENGVPEDAQDPQVLVPGGWRGPYLRLPMGAKTLLDAWGNPMASPDTTGYARLRDADDHPITTSEQEIRVIRHLGANGQVDDDDDDSITDYDRDVEIELTDEKFRASLTGQVEVLDGNTRAIPTPPYTLPDTPTPGTFEGNVIVRVFGPNPEKPAQISVESIIIPFTTNPVTWPMPPPNLETTILKTTIGPRVVRAYFVGKKHVENASPFSLSLTSAVKHVTLRPGVNLIDLTIDRPTPVTPPTP